MRWSSEAPRARILRGATVQPFLLATVPAERELGAEAAPTSSVPQPWDGRERRSGGELVSARQEAFQAGYEEGRRDAERQCGAARSELERARAALIEAAVQLDGQRAAALAVAEEDVASLAFSVAEAVLQRELRLADDPGRDAVARALALLPPEVDVVLRLHPEDAALVESWSEDGRRLSVVPDPAIERGGCLADAGACSIDAQVSTALARVRKVLCGGEDDL